jgi:hypothetical protein
MIQVPTYLLGAALTIALLVVGSSSSSQPQAVAKTSDTARLRYRGAGQALEDYGRVRVDSEFILELYVYIRCIYVYTCYIHTYP